MTRKRREFSKAVKVEIMHRATRENERGLHVVYCEGCGLPAKRWDFDHTIPEELIVDKSKPLTAKDGKLLCAGSRYTCHGRKTAEQDQPDIARAKRREAGHLGITKYIGPDRRIRTAPMPTTRKAAARAARGHKPSLAPLRLYSEGVTP